MRSIFAIGLLSGLLLTAGCDTHSALQYDPAGDRPEDALTEAEQAFLDEQGFAAGKHGSASISRAPVLTLSEEDPVGRSRLIRFGGGVLATIQTSELEPGTAATLWMVVFNAPEHCSDGVCGADDVRNPDARVDLLGVDGQVIGRSGRAHYFVFRREGDTSGSIAKPFLGTPAYGIEDARKAEVHYVVRTHGPVIPGMEREMTSTFNGGCQRGSLPDDLRLGRPGPNTCANLQFAVHLP